MVNVSGRYKLVRRWHGAVGDELRHVYVTTIPDSKGILPVLTFAFIEEAAGLKERHVLSNLFGACR